MAYLRLNAGFFRDPVIVTLSRDAKALHLAAMCYVAGTGSGGRFPFAALGIIARDAGVDTPIRLSVELGRAGLWRGDEESFEIVGGVRIWAPETHRPPASVWKRLREAVFTRDDYTCRYCGARGGRLECDHVVPVSRGGGHEDSNLVTACFSCNRSKRARLIGEWL